MKILDGRKIAKIKEEQLIKAVAKFSNAPELAIILVGDRADSLTYVKQKMKVAERIGVKAHLFSFDKNIKQKELISRIEELNSNPKINGIIVQMPLPDGLNSREIIDVIVPEKDVDGLTTINQGKLLTNDNRAFIPATALGIINLLELSNISLEGKRVAMIGRSLLVGRPTALMVEKKGATVIQCHSHTKKLSELTKIADIIIVAVGKPKLITEKHVKKGQVVVDVGITVVKKGENKILLGDVDYEKVSKIVKAISPVPGGVGPMTVISLLENVVNGYQSQKAKLKNQNYN